MAWKNRFIQVFRLVAVTAVTTVVIIAVILAATVAPSMVAADSKTSTTYAVLDQGLSCELPLLKPWQKFPSIFGFSSILFQEASVAKDQEARVMLGFVITPYDDPDGKGFAGGKMSPKGLERQYESFRRAKKQYVEGEGGKFLGAAESLTGENGIHRISVRYHLDGDDLQDSSYFFFVQGRLFHAKALIPLKAFDAKVIEKQIFELLKGIQCQRDD